MAASTRIGAVAGLTHKLGRNWGLQGYVGYDRLVGDAADSPIVRAFGSRDQFSGGAGLFFEFNIWRQSREPNVTVAILESDCSRSRWCGPSRSRRRPRRRRRPASNCASSEPRSSASPGGASDGIWSSASGSWASLRPGPARVGHVRLLCRPQRARLDRVRAMTAARAGTPCDSLPSPRLLLALAAPAAAQLTPEERRMAAAVDREADRTSRCSSGW